MAVALVQRGIHADLRAEVCQPDRGDLAARIRTQRLVPYRPSSVPAKPPTTPFLRLRTGHHLNWIPIEQALCRITTTITQGGRDLSTAPPQQLDPSLDPATVGNDWPWPVCAYGSGRWWRLNTGGGMAMRGTRTRGCCLTSRSGSVVPQTFIAYCAVSVSSLPFVKQLPTWRHPSMQ